MKFSIIIPVYNVERFIRECLMSVVTQNYDSSDFEIIVVDDCSPDNSISIVEEIQAEHSNIRVIRHEKNLHIGGARNTGIKNAQGKYLFFLDSDDKWMHRDVLKNFDAIISQYDGVNIVKSSTYSEFDARDIQCRIKSLQSVVEYLSSDDFMVNVWTGCYSRQMLIQNNVWFREHVSYEDTDWSLKVSCVASSILCIDYPFYGYRLNESSITNSTTKSTLIGNVLGIVSAYEYLTKGMTDSTLYKPVSCFVMTSALRIPMICRNFKLDMAMECINPLLQSGLLTDSSMVRTQLQKAYAFIFLNFPYALIWSIQKIVFSRRYLRRLIRSIKK